MGIKQAAITVFAYKRLRGIFCTGREGMKLYAISENHLFSKAYSKGKRCSCKNIAVYVLKDYHADRLRKENPLKQRINRIGITASKKIGGAVVRNRVKRIIREAYVYTDKSCILKKGFLIVIAARESAKEAKTQEVAKDLAYALGKLEMIASAQVSRTFEEKESRKEREGEKQ